MIKHFLMTALATALLAVGGLQVAGAQDVAGFDGTYYYDPSTTPAGYYYVVTGWNNNYALHVTTANEPYVDNLDQEDQSFIWYLAPTNKAKNTQGTPIGNSAFYLYSGNPVNEIALAQGGGSNAAANTAADGGTFGWAEVGTQVNGQKTFRWNCNNQTIGTHQRDFSPQSETADPPQRLWSYGNRNDYARWHFLPVSDDQLKILLGNDFDAYKATYNTNLNAGAIQLAIAAFEELTTFVENIGTEVGKYDYSVSSEDQKLIAGAYNQESTYASLTLAEINALAAQFTALTAAIKATYVWPEVSIVTLSWDGGRYAGLNGGTDWGANTFAGPDGGNGKMGIIKTANKTFKLASQGIFVKISDSNALEVATEATATEFNISGSFEEGVNFQVAGKEVWLTGGGNNNRFQVVTTAPTKNFKVNSYTNSTKARENLIQVGTRYWGAICLPYKVQKPNVDDTHMYTVKLDGGNLVTTEVTEAEAGEPFIFSAPNNDNATREFIIPQTGQAYAETSLSTSFLKGYFVNQPNDVFYFDNSNGEASFSLNGADKSNNVDRAYIAVDAYEGATKYVWNAETNQLEVVTYSQAYLDLQAEIEAAETILAAKKNDNGVSDFTAAINAAKAYTDGDTEAKEWVMMQEQELEKEMLNQWEELVNLKEI